MTDANAAAALRGGSLVCRPIRAPSEPQGFPLGSNNQDGTRCYGDRSTAEPAYTVGLESVRTSWYKV